MPQARFATAEPADVAAANRSEQSRGRRPSAHEARDSGGTARLLVVTQLPLAQNTRASGPTQLRDAPIIVLADRRPAPSGTPVERLRGAAECAALYRRAQTLWPRLDPRALARTHGDPRRVARLVARRTNLSEDAIVSLLERES